jgi:hypothetical protein
VAYRITSHCMVTKHNGALSRRSLNFIVRPLVMLSRFFMMGLDVWAIHSDILLFCLPATLLLDGHLDLQPLPPTLHRNKLFNLPCGHEMPMFLKRPGTPDRSPRAREHRESAASWPPPPTRRILSAPARIRGSISPRGPPMATASCGMLLHFRSFVKQLRE